MKRSAKLFLGLIGVAVAALPLAAAEKKIMEQPDPAMMQAMKLGLPAEAHKKLEPMVGKFDAVVRMWVSPGAKPVESKGASENAWEFGGRFLKQNFKGDGMGQPFEGVGYTGYDNMREEYQSIWMDNMSSSMMLATGTYDDASKSIKTGGDFSCPMTGEKHKWMRSEIKIKDNNQHTYLSYFKDASNKEFKAMEIIYTRAK